MAQQPNHRAAAAANPHTAPTPSSHPPLPVIPAPLSPSFLRPSPRHSCAPSPSFLRPLPVIPAPPPRHSCAPSPSFLRPLPVIPAQAGTTHPTPNSSRPLPQSTPPFLLPNSSRPLPPIHPAPFPNSSLPPSRGEVRWGVGGNDLAPPAAPRPDRPHPPPLPILTPHLRHLSTSPPPLLRPQPSSLRPPSVIPAQAGTTLSPNCRPPHTPTFPTSCYPQNRTGVPPP